MLTVHSAPQGRVYPLQRLIDAGVQIDILPRVFVRAVRHARAQLQRDIRACSDQATKARLALKARVLNFSLCVLKDGWGAEKTALDYPSLRAFEKVGFFAFDEIFPGKDYWSIAMRPLLAASPMLAYESSVDALERILDENAQAFATQAILRIGGNRAESWHSATIRFSEPTVTPSPEVITLFDRTYANVKAVDHDDLFPEGIHGMFEKKRHGIYLLDRYGDAVAFIRADGTGPVSIGRAGSTNLYLQSLSANAREWLNCPAAEVLRRFEARQLTKMLYAA